MRMLHERTGKHVLHLMVKANDGDWNEQPNVPAYSQEVSILGNHKEFWEWAEKNLPIYDHQKPVKSGYAETSRQ